jgi:hypothetical protein
MRRTLAAFGVVVLLGSCSEETILAVDLRTDYVPGIEFASVRTVLVGEAGAGDRSTTAAARLDDDFVAGRRVAEIDGLAAGSTLPLRVELMAADGRAIAARPVRVTFEGRTAVTVVVTRDCTGVACPIAGGDPLATACLNGRCVDPACTPETPDACGEPSCSAPSECADGSMCATPVCVAGTCLLDAEAGRCGRDEYCDPEAGCRALPTPTDSMPPADAGVDGTLPLPRCADMDLGSALGADVASGNADGMGNDVDLDFSCDDGARDDASYLWTAPADGIYDVVASSDGSMLVIGAVQSCDSLSVRCQSTSGDGDVSIDLEAGAGDRWIVVVDAQPGGRVGNYTLSVFRECPDDDLASALGPGIAAASSAGARDGLSGSCGGTGGDDVSFTWMVPATGRYRITVSASTFDPVVYVRDGGCRGAELGCAAGSGGTVTLDVDLIGAVPTVLVVDTVGAAGGSFTLGIEGL